MISEDKMKLVNKKISDKYKNVILIYYISHVESKIYIIMHDLKNKIKDYKLEFSLSEIIDNSPFTIYDFLSKNYEKFLNEMISKS